jgi:hypothetical protein
LVVVRSRTGSIETGRLKNLTGKYLGPGEQTMRFQHHPSSLSVFALLLIAPLVGACSATSTTILKEQTRSLNLSYETAFPATIDALLQHGLVIDHSDVGSGVLSCHRVEFGWNVSVGTILLVLPFIGFSESPRVESLSLHLHPIGADHTRLRVVRVRYAGSTELEVSMNEFIHEIEEAARLLALPP